MFYQILLSPQVKRIVIISNKHGIHELPRELPNDYKRKTVQKLKVNFSRSALFLINTKVCLIYFDQDCRFIVNCFQNGVRKFF